MQLLVRMNLSDWVGDGGSKKGMSMRELVRGVGQGSFQSMHQAGSVCMGAYNVPEMLSIQTLYGTRFGIELSSAYSCAMKLGDDGEDDGDERANGRSKFMDWFVSLTHVLGCTLQLLCCTCDRKMKACFPPWLASDLEKLFASNHKQLEGITSSGNGTFQMDDWARQFSLKNFASRNSEHVGDCFMQPCNSVVGMEARVARHMLRDRGGRHQTSLLVEQFMRSISHGMGLSVMAKTNGVRVCNERKRKSAESDSSQSED